MKHSLLKKSPYLFPIATQSLNVYIRGIRLKTIGRLTFANYETRMTAPESGIKLFNIYKDTVLTDKELHLITDWIKDLVKEGKLDNIFLKDLDKQASFISETLKCICSVSQLQRFYKEQHPIKSKLKRIKLLNKHEFHKR